MVARYAVIVLAGGAAQRLGGRDKPALPVGGRPMLDRVLAAASGATRRIVVGPARAGVPADVIQVREEPPGGGPVAALAAGLVALARGEWIVAGETRKTGPADQLSRPGDPERAVGEGDGLVAVLAADLPFLIGADIDALRDAVGAGGDSTGALDADAMAADAMAAHAMAADAVGGAVTGGGATGELDGAVLVDDAGRPQWLCAVYRVAALRRRLGELGPPAGQSVRQLVAGLRLATVVRASTPPPWYDCDTEDDYRRAEELA
jgi:molybdopterin-guanine dinucleotide biosynthesis protein A